jgi:hypothetical protein
MKIHEINRYTPGLLAVVSAISLVVTDSAQAQRAVGRWNLGEQDTGAVAGNLGGDTTYDAIGTINLAASGSPVYSDSTPSSASKLSMFFDGGSFYQAAVNGNGAAVDQFYSTLNFNNFSLSCDVNIQAAGSAGFSFPVSIGANNGGIALVEVGGNWYLIHQGKANSVAGPAISTDTWTHFDIIRKDFGSGVVSVLYMNGSPVITNSASLKATPTDFLTIGANQLNTMPGNVEGYFQGWVDNVVITNFDIDTPPSLTGLTVSPGTIYSGNSIILSVSGLAGDSTNLKFTWRREGVVLTNTTTHTYTIPNATEASAGNYDVVVANAFGSVTSAVVAVTIQSASLSAGADVLKCRLGDDDAGAVAGAPVNATTKDIKGGCDLTAMGSLFYSDVVPTNGNAISVAFDGFSGFDNVDTISNVFGSTDFNNFSISCDVYPTALGGEGFSFPVSMGDNNGGFAIVEIGGKWCLIHQMAGTSDAGPAVVLNQWTHLELQHRMFGSSVSSRLFVNGVDAGVSISSVPPLPINHAFSIGFNFLKGDESTEGCFIGMIDNVVIHDYSAGTKPTITAGPGSATGTNLAFGETLFLTGAGSGALPLTFSWRKDGVVFTNVTTEAALIEIPLLSVAQSGAYDFILSNPAGAVTSSVVQVTVQPAGWSRNAPKAVYNMGDDDSGAVNGEIAASTRDASGTLDLTDFGTAVYSDQTPASNSKFSMMFDGFSYFGGSGDDWTSFYSSFDFKCFKLSCNVYPTALGGSGFSFPVSIGGSGTGLGIVEIGGKWCVIHHGVVCSAAGPDVVLDQWTHLELVRGNFGAGMQSRLLIDGVDVNTYVTGTPNTPLAAFWVGGNFHAGNAEGQFSGFIDNVVLSTFTPVVVGPGTLSLRMAQDGVKVDCHGTAGIVYTLWRATSLATPQQWTSIATGTADATGTVELADPNPPTTAAFYRTTAN